MSQDQRSLTDQLAELKKLAVQHGLYDAADWLSASRQRVEEVEGEVRRECARAVLRESYRFDTAVTRYNTYQRLMLKELADAMECGREKHEVPDATE